MESSHESKLEALAFEESDVEDEMNLGSLTLVRQTSYFQPSDLVEMKPNDGYEMISPKDFSS